VDEELAAVVGLNKPKSLKPTNGEDEYYLQAKRIAGATRYDED
jgi:hypothetical protein